MNKKALYNVLPDRIFEFNISQFDELALDVFNFQYKHNHTYRQYTDTLGVIPDKINTIFQIPFLPIRFFKSHRVCSTVFEPEGVFESSGTTGTINSKHYIRDLTLYKRNFLRGFKQFYGNPKEWCIIGLLPSYLERDNSSLVVMADELIRQSGHEKSGFYLNEYDKLAYNLKELEQSKQKTLLIGVTFALLDFAEQFPIPLQHTIVMETGGMKGRKTEMTRQEVHDKLKKAFDLTCIHSEYGMTELLSQAYSVCDGFFYKTDRMRVLIRDEDDPFEIKLPGEKAVNGVLNIIDLANIYSCSFIATDDAGRLHVNGSFEVLGRVDSSDIRGCSLMAV